MDYIISPAWVYSLQILSALRSTVYCFTVVLFTLSALLGLFFMLSWDDEDDEFHNMFKKALKPSLISAIVLLILYIFIPSRETMITMMVAKFATYTNAQWTIDTLKAAVDYIVQAIQQIT